MTIEVSKIDNYLKYIKLITTMSKNNIDKKIVSDYTDIITLKKQIVINNLQSYSYELSYYDDNTKTIKTYIHKILYNDYLLEHFHTTFYNKIYSNFNLAIIQDFITKNDIFINSLTERELYTIKYYTYHGDILLNLYIQHTKKGTFDKNIIIKAIKEYCGSIKDVDTNICLFYYQFMELFKDIYNDEDEIIENYEKFSTQDYAKLFELYIRDFNLIFAKAPKTDEILWLYRGIENDYISGEIKNNRYINEQYMSTSLFVEKAYEYTKKSNRQIYRFRINKKTPLLFVQGISLAKEGYDFEVIIPINFKFKMEPERINETIIFNKMAAKEYICAEEYQSTDIISIIDIN